MRIHQHAAVSLMLSGLLYIVFKSWAMAAANLAAGVLIDIDYAADYVMQRGYRLNIKQFMDAYRSNSLLKVRLLHGWEWLVVLGLAAWLTDWKLWVAGVFVGFGQHLILDKINFGERFLCYSLLWRWKKGFKSEAIFKKSIRRDKNGHIQHDR
ncbi:MAG: hypothetical protein AB1499_03645 [Nitrospirota bacterium]